MTTTVHQTHQICMFKVTQHSRTTKIVGGVQFLEETTPFYLIHTSSCSNQASYQIDMKEGVYS